MNQLPSKGESTVGTTFQVHGFIKIYMQESSLKVLLFGIFAALGLDFLLGGSD